VIEVNKTIGKIAVVGTMFSAFVAHAASVGNVIVVPPSELPAASREYSEAMMLHETLTGKLYLYIEQQQGAQLAVLDVTNPARIKAEKPVALNVAGPFDFVGSAGSRNELIRFRGTGQEAVLDLHKAKVPSVDALPEIIVTGQLMPSSAQQTPYQRVSDVKGVRQEITDDQTGTTYLLAEEGLFVVRRPSVQPQVLESVVNNSGG
jgi:hypothetical protein